jgi:CheY-like chemotaxis protein
MKDSQVTHPIGVFMDYHMPQCSGVDAIIQIRRLEKQHGVDFTPIIAFTADLTPTSRSAFMAVGANDIMEKPTPAGRLEEYCYKMATKQV